MQQALLLLGSNQGNREALLENARNSLVQGVGEITRVSSLYETAPWGITNQPDFLNQVIEINTLLSPEVLLKTTLRIEEQLGRYRSYRNAPRTIDIDILFYGNEIVQLPHLQIPHPRLQDRLFVLIPLQELVPQLVHPVLKKTVDELVEACADPLNVKKM